MVQFWLDMGHGWTSVGSVWPGLLELGKGVRKGWIDGILWH